MILEALYQHFADLASEKFRTLGASSLGYCAKRLAMGHHPEVFTPEPMSARRRARMTGGQVFERHVVGLMESQAVGQVTGETAFLWPVDVDNATLSAAITKVARGQLAGFVRPGFDPDDIKGWRVLCADRGMSRLGGIIVDPARSRVLVPALADIITDVPGYGLATGEFKTIATAGFRRVLTGEVDYAYRVQMAIQVAASRLDTHVGIFYRLETSHGIEIVYSRKVDKIRIEVLLTNGERRIVDAGGADRGVAANVPAFPSKERLAGGTPTPALTDLDPSEWDAVQVDTPFDSSLLEGAAARLRRVLVSSPGNLPPREYGPSFVCDKCSGRGEHVCAYCDGTGISKRSKKGNQCQVCLPTAGGEVYRGMVDCKACNAGGTLDATPLPFPCSYCPFVAACWTRADGIPLYSLEFQPARGGGKRPVLLVKREDYEREGITFVSPEGER